MAALEALKRKGAVAWDGDMLSRFVLELRGSWLHIFGRGACYINAARTCVLQEEYHYYLEMPQAARLFAALQQDYGTEIPPEQIIAQEFEFTNPQNQLNQYLDMYQIEYDHTIDKIGL